MKQKLSPALKHGLSAGLIISSFIFITCVCLFFWGCDILFRTQENITWLWVVIISFIISIPAMAMIVKCKTEIDRYIDIGQPVYIAAEYVKEIMKEVNVFGVTNLKDIMGKAMERELEKLVKDKEGKGK